VTCRSDFLDDDYVYPPLAPLYLKSWLKRHSPDWATTIVGKQYELAPDFWEQYTAVGVSIMTPQREEAKRVLDSIKACKKKPLAIAGGAHCRGYIADVQQEAWDYIVPFDGEKPLEMILAGSTAERVLFKVMDANDINDAPRPDRTSWDAVNLLYSHNYTLQGKLATTMITSKGCPEHCKFCESAQTPVRRYSLGNIEEQLMDIVNLQYFGVYLFDDLFTMSMSTSQPVCNLLEQYELIYRCNGQAKHFSRNGTDFARMLKDTGCIEIAFGFESGSQAILDSSGKRTSVKDNYAAAKYAKDAGLFVKGYLMLGLPGETLETIAETERFIKDSGIDDFQLACFMPYKGTMIRRLMDEWQPIDCNLIVPEVSGAFGKKGGETTYEVCTSALDAEAIKRERNRLVMKYRPVSHKGAWMK
jgi:anaerobic magnesium-protoporphyrin IX monomethyl ester cyclase